MAKITNRLAAHPISRRDFLKGSAAATAAIAGLSLTGCSQNTVSKTTEAPDGSGSADTTSEAPVSHPEPVNPEEGGTWISAACWHNCGGRCVNRVLMKDGIVIRQKTDDSIEDSFDTPQQRSCLRGHSQQKQCFGADRLRVPMKRKHWEPLTGGDKSLRGKDEWEPISWEEAIKYVADEIQYNIGTYGNGSILVPGYSSYGTAQAIKMMGGHVAETCTSSYGTYNGNITLYGLPNTNASAGQGTLNDRYDLPNAKTIIFTGSNPAWSAMGSQMNNFLNAKEKGTEFVYIGPNYNATAQALDARWITVRPGTDTAFLLATSYEMLRLDAEEGNIIDWDFLYKYTLGFDADHLPSDAALQEGFAEYVKGEYDGIPKTPEWASKICGTSAEDITWYARLIGKENAVMLMNTYAPARNRGAENYPQLAMTIGMMGGHMNKPGHATGITYHRESGNVGPKLALPGSNGLGYAGSINMWPETITSIELWDAVLNGTYHSVGAGWGNFQPIQEKTCDIHMIYHDSYAYLQTGVNIMGGIEAHRKVDFVCTKAMFLTPQAKYADIVLPVTTKWEQPGGMDYSNREALIVWKQVTEPLYEAKSDQEIETLLMQELGIDPAIVYPISAKAQFFNQLRTCTYLDPAYQRLPICTITQEDIDAWGVADELAAAGIEVAPQEGAVTLNEFLDRGCFTVPRSEGDSYYSLAYTWAGFFQDPEANPLPSNSGKFEIYCQPKADLMNNMFPGPEVKPYPNYLVPTEGYETTFKDGDLEGEKGEYPYLVYNPHYFRRSHSTYDNVGWLREACPNPVFLSAADAAEKGIETGDTVLIYNKYGKVLRQASVVETIMPGVLALPHGSWVDLDEETGIDRGGADNVLCGPITSNLSVAGYNNYNCNFEKYDGEPLVPDCEKPQTILSFE